MRHRAANLGQRDDLNKTKSFNEFYDDTRKELIDRTRSETSRFRKIILLIVAVTIHNIPGIYNITLNLIQHEKEEEKKKSREN